MKWLQNLVVTCIKKGLIIIAFLGMQQNLFAQKEFIDAVQEKRWNDAIAYLNKTIHEPAYQGHPTVLQGIVNDLVNHYNNEALKSGIPPLAPFHAGQQDYQLMPAQFQQQPITGQPQFVPGQIPQQPQQFQPQQIIQQPLPGQAPQQPFVPGVPQQPQVVQPQVQPQQGVFAPSPHVPAGAQPQVPGVQPQFQPQPQFVPQQQPQFVPQPGKIVFQNVEQAERLLDDKTNAFDKTLSAIIKNLKSINSHFSANKFKNSKNSLVMPSSSLVKQAQDVLATIATIKSEIELQTGPKVSIESQHPETAFPEFAKKVTTTEKRITALKDAVDYLATMLQQLYAAEGYFRKKPTANNLAELYVIQRDFGVSNALNKSRDKKIKTINNELIKVVNNLLEDIDTQYFDLIDEAKDIAKKQKIKAPYKKKKVSFKEPFEEKEIEKQRTWTKQRIAIAQKALEKVTPQTKITAAYASIKKAKEMATEFKEAQLLQARSLTNYALMHKQLLDAYKFAPEGSSLKYFVLGAKDFIQMLEVMTRFEISTIENTLKKSYRSQFGSFMKKQLDLMSFYKSNLLREEQEISDTNLTILDDLTYNFEEFLYKIAPETRKGRLEPIIRWFTIQPATQDKITELFENLHIAGKEFDGVVYNENEIATNNLSNAIEALMKAQVHVDYLLSDIRKKDILFASSIAQLQEYIKFARSIAEKIDAFYLRTLEERYHFTSSEKREFDEAISYLIILTTYLKEFNPILFSLVPENIAKPEDIKFIYNIPEQLIKAAQAIKITDGAKSVEDIINYAWEPLKRFLGVEARSSIDNLVRAETDLQTKLANLDDRLRALDLRNFDTILNGMADDLKKASKIATAHLTDLMNKKQDASFLQVSSLQDIASVIEKQKEIIGKIKEFNDFGTDASKRLAQEIEKKVDQLKQTYISFIESYGKIRVAARELLIPTRLLAVLNTINAHFSSIAGKIKLPAVRGEEVRREGIRPREVPTTETRFIFGEPVKTEEKEKKVEFSFEKFLESPSKEKTLEFSEKLTDLEQNILGKLEKYVNKAIENSYAVQTFLYGLKNAFKAIFEVNKFVSGNNFDSDMNLFKEAVKTLAPVTEDSSVETDKNAGKNFYFKIIKYLTENQFKIKAMNELAWKIIGYLGQLLGLKKETTMPTWVALERPEITKLRKYLENVGNKKTDLFSYLSELRGADKKQGIFALINQLKIDLKDTNLKNDLDILRELLQPIEYLTSGTSIFGGWLGRSPEQTAETILNYIDGLKEKLKTDEMKDIFELIKKDLNSKMSKAKIAELPREPQKKKPEIVGITAEEREKRVDTALPAIKTFLDKSGTLIMYLSQLAAKRSMLEFLKRDLSFQDPFYKDIDFLLKQIPEFKDFATITQEYNRNPSIISQTYISKFKQYSRSEVKTDEARKIFQEILNDLESFDPKTGGKKVAPITTETKGTMRPESIVKIADVFNMNENDAYSRSKNLINNYVNQLKELDKTLSANLTKYDNEFKSDKSLTPEQRNLFNDLDKIDKAFSEIKTSDATGFAQELAEKLNKLTFESSGPDAEKIKNSILGSLNNFGIKPKEEIKKEQKELTVAEVTAGFKNQDDVNWKLYAEKEPRNYNKYLESLIDLSQQLKTKLDGLPKTQQQGDEYNELKRIPEIIANAVKEAGKGQTAGNIDLKKFLNELRRTLKAGEFNGEIKNIIGQVIKGFVSINDAYSKSTSPIIISLKKVTPEPIKTTVELEKLPEGAKAFLKVLSDGLNKIPTDALAKYIPGISTLGNYIASEISKLEKSNFSIDFTEISNILTINKTKKFPSNLYKGVNLYKTLFKNLKEDKFATTSVKDFVQKLLDKTYGALAFASKADAFNMETVEGVADKFFYDEFADFVTKIAGEKAPKDGWKQYLSNLSAPNKQWNLQANLSKINKSDQLFSELVSIKNALVNAWNEAKQGKEGPIAYSLVENLRKELNLLMTFSPNERAEEIRKEILDSVNYIYLEFIKEKEPKIEKAVIKSMVPVPLRKLAEQDIESLTDFIDYLQELNAIQGISLNDYLLRLKQDIVDSDVVNELIKNALGQEQKDLRTIEQILKTNLDSFIPLATGKKSSNVQEILNAMLKDLNNLKLTTDNPRNIAVQLQKGLQKFKSAAMTAVFKKPPQKPKLIQTAFQVGASKYLSKPIVNEADKKLEEKMLSVLAEYDGNDVGVYLQNYVKGKLENEILANPEQLKGISPALQTDLKKLEDIITTDLAKVSNISEPENDKQAAQELLMSLMGAQFSSPVAKEIVEQIKKDLREKFKISSGALVVETVAPAKTEGETPQTIAILPTKEEKQEAQILAKKFENILEKISEQKTLSDYFNILQIKISELEKQIKVVSNKANNYYLDLLNFVQAYKNAASEAIKKDPDKKLIANNFSSALKEKLEKLKTQMETDEGHNIASTILQALRSFEAETPKTTVTIPSKEIEKVETKETTAQNLINEQTEKLKMAVNNIKATTFETFVNALKENGEFGKQLQASLDALKNSAIEDAKSLVNDLGLLKITIAQKSNDQNTLLRSLQDLKTNIKNTLSISLVDILIEKLSKIPETKEKTAQNLINEQTEKLKVAANAIKATNLADYVAVLKPEGVFGKQLQLRLRRLAQIKTRQLKNL